VESLASAIDIAPTILSLAGAPVPETVQGTSMLPLFSDPKAQIRSYAFSEHNWHDYEAHGRSVRDGEYLYIRNRLPEKAWQGPADSVRSPSHQSLLHAEKDTLNVYQQDVLLAPRPEEELYLCVEDATQTNNLAGNPAHEPALNRLRNILDEWEQQTGDSLSAEYSKDAFDRQSGERLPDVKGNSHYGTPAGSDNEASKLNNPGPR
jgi:arylsulfatase A-like enzyme